MSTVTTFQTGNMVKARGRDWIVLPDSTPDLLMVRPLSGSEWEVTGISPHLEEVTSAGFDLPDTTHVGDHQSCQLLREAVQLGFRSSSGPFRSFANISVEPHPYQLVPLMMALKLNPVRMLIADDVGIGKTIEACLIAKELLVRGEIQRLAVLCPPHLAEQWQKELYDKFNIEAELVLSSTATRLERSLLLKVGESIFERIPFTIVSLDYIKTESRRQDFVRACPEMIIVDEAHTCAYGNDKRSSHQQRHRLLHDLAKNPNRHLLLVTATPHNGKTEDFRSLLGLLQPEFENLPEDLSGPQNESRRRELARYLVQRRRADIRHYLGTDTVFPERLEAEEHYKMAGSFKYQQLFSDVMAYAREKVQDRSGSLLEYRVRWWSVLALLRSLASSPAAAAETLHNRAQGLDCTSEKAIDDLCHQNVLDGDDVETCELSDTVAGSDISQSKQDPVYQRLCDLAIQAAAIAPEEDPKLQGLIRILKALIKEGYRPIVFCRFIPTVDYIVTALRETFKRNIEIDGITGLLPASERENRIQLLSESESHILVCTDCLSEGINLQNGFDAVIHYDLAWNPTRHEQREGRVDRFGQNKATVKVVTYYGIDNQIDGIILDILIKKHKEIRRDLGITVSVPRDNQQVIEAVFEGLLLREQQRPMSSQSYLPGFDELFKPQKESLFLEWENARDKEKKSMTLFAQASIHPEQVLNELNAMQEALGNGNLESFVTNTLIRLGALRNQDRYTTFNLNDVSQHIQDLFQKHIQTNRKSNLTSVQLSYKKPSPEQAIYLHRTHPIVEGLANVVMSGALDTIAGQKSVASRIGAIRTRSVTKATTLLVLRYRFQIIKTMLSTGDQHPLLAEECRVLGFEGLGQHINWLSPECVSQLLQVSPDANILPDVARNFLDKILQDHIPDIRPTLDEDAQVRAKLLLAAHRRVRDDTAIKGIQYKVEPQLPVDILGVYILLPVAG